MIPLFSHTELSTVQKCVVEEKKSHLLAGGFISDLNEAQSN